MDEGTLIEWTVVPGQQVRNGDIVAIVDTTKAAVDVESWADGTVHQLLTQAGETVAVGTVMARLLAPGEAAPAALPAAAVPTAMPVPAPAPAQDLMAPATLPAETAAAAVAHLRPGHRHRHGSRHRAGRRRYA